MFDSEVTQNLSKATQDLPFSALESNQSLDSVSQSAILPPIEQRYLMIIDIDSYLDDDGRRYVDPLWYKDLLQHLVYLKQFVLAAPCRHEAPPANAIALDADPRFADVEFIDLPAADNNLQAILQIPKVFALFWKAIQQADIVHSAIAARYIPPAWIVTPITRWHQKFYLIVVESAFWRSPADLQESLKRRIKSAMFEMINRWCIAQTDLAIFTQPQYRESLATQTPEQGFVIHASWIDAEHILSDSEAESLWQEKLPQPGGPLKVLFAGRVETYKGVAVLLQAMQILSQKQISIHLDILGLGTLLPECKKASQSVQSPAQIGVLSPVAYGPELFQVLQHYHLVVVPSISDEQPRIVYDAYSQAVPVLASATSGLQTCVWQDKTGLLFKVGDAGALASCLEEMVEQPFQLREIGLNALHTARQLTHQEMHRKRWQILLHKLGLSTPATPQLAKNLASDRVSVLDG